MFRSSWHWFGWGLVITLVLVGCQAMPTATPGVGITVARTDEPLPGMTNVNTGGAATPAPPTVEPSAPPATTLPVYGPDGFPENINPLTGETVDPAKLNRLPVAAKISNFPYAVRPQWGLAQADVVFEHLAEQGVTRFTAIFLQNDVIKVGSIRSARWLDAELAPIFEALLVTSGSSFGTMDHLRANTWFVGNNDWRLVAETNHYNTCPPLCHETPEDTNTLFASTDGVRQVAGQRGNVNVRLTTAGLAFAAQPPTGGVPVAEMLFNFSSAAHVSWRYTAASGRYERWQDKDPSGEMAVHLDAATSMPITAANVVLLQAHHVNNWVPEDFHDGGVCGMEIQLWTIGPARIFRDGVMVEGRWRRDETTRWKLRLEDTTGQVIPLKPGNTWFGVMALIGTVEINGQTVTANNKVIDTRIGCPVPPTETPDPNAPPTVEGTAPAPG